CGSRQRALGREEEEEFFLPRPTRHRGFCSATVERLVTRGARAIRSRGCASARSRSARAIVHVIAPCGGNSSRCCTSASSRGERCAAFVAYSARPARTAPSPHAKAPTSSAIVPAARTLPALLTPPSPTNSVHASRRAGGSNRRNPG